MADTITKDDPRYERLYQAWLSDKKQAGYLCIGTEMYRVIAKNDFDVVFVPETGGIDSNYSTTTGGLPE